MNIDWNIAGPYLVAVVNFIGLIYVGYKDWKKGNKIDHIESINSTLNESFVELNRNMLKIIHEQGVTHELYAKRILGVVEELKEHRVSNRHRLVLNLENKVFSILSRVQMIIAEMNHILPGKKRKTKATGSYVFRAVKDQYIRVYHRLQVSHGGQHGVLSEQDILDISYKVVYFGVSVDSIASLGSSLKMYDQNTISDILSHLPTEKTKYNEKIVYYGGHQTRLGHYFRLLYNLVEFIDQSKGIEQDDKNLLMKLVRSQMTTYEQFVLFATSMSTIGREWRSYISKYNLIKNIPERFVSAPKIRDHYPEVIFEDQKE